MSESNLPLLINHHTHNNELIGEPLSPEADTTDPIVAENLAILTGPQMDRVIRAESRGGNAGVQEVDGEVIDLVAVNGYADKTTGRITYLGNALQSLDPTRTEYDVHFSMIVAPSRRTFEEKIISFLPKENDGINPEGLTRLHESVSLYNEQAPWRASEVAAELTAQYGAAALQAIGFVAR